MKRVSLFAVFFLAGCGSQAGVSPVGDAASEAGNSPDGAPTGSIHVAWTLQRSDGSATDCIAAQTSNIELDVSTTGLVRVFRSTNYCVDMAETVPGLPPGSYVVGLGLYDATNSIVATAGSGAVSVTAGAVADAGSLTLVLPGP